MALALASLLFANCGETSGPVAPDGTAGFLQRPQGSTPALQADDDLIGFSTERVLTFLVPPDLTQPRHAEKLIRADKGGTVALNGFKVRIPAGALAEDTVITIDLPLALPEALYLVADFGPDGLTFQKPVKITMPLEGVDLLDVDLSKVRIWFWTGSSWKEPKGRVNAAGTAITGNTTHFSTYGARKGIDTPSGG